MKDSCDCRVLWHGLGHPLSVPPYAAVVNAAGRMIGTNARGL